MNREERSRRDRSMPPCTECRRNTPRLGETVCGRCQEAHETQDAKSAAISDFYTNIDAVDDPAVAECLRALFVLTDAGSF